MSNRLSSPATAALTISPPPGRERCRRISWRPPRRSTPPLPCSGSARRSGTTGSVIMRSAGEIENQKGLCYGICLNMPSTSSRNGSALLFGCYEEDYRIKSWRDEDDKNDESSGPSWFRGHRWVRNPKNNGFHPHDFYYGNFRSRGGFEFCPSDEDEPETVFRNAFRGHQTFYWSFDSDDFCRRNHRRSHSESSRRWSYETDDEDETPVQTEVSLARQALGLSTSGPLKLEDVKSAYRTCALRWHPDRHNGSTKATAEEKFKHCSAAYQTLCDSLASA